jgi:hypothetical protein
LYSGECIRGSRPALRTLRLGCPEVRAKLSYGRRRAAAEASLEKLHRKQNFIETFASKIEQYLTLTVGLRKREIFLAEWAKVPEHATARFSDGRTFDETRAKWEEDKR